MKKIVKKVITYSLILILVAGFLSIPVITKQGVNYEVRTLRTPLYIKIIEYFDRDYCYRKLAKEITAGCITDSEKVIAIFKWVVKNIHKHPEGFDIVDDHTLNIIIRQYGTHDQMGDVFTTLSVYSGFPAFCSFDIPSDRNKHITLSYVLLDNRWRAFDIYNNTFFLNDRGEIASVEDIISEPSIIKGEEKKAIYEERFKNLKPIKKDFISKAEKQIPILRIKYEIKHMLTQIANFGKGEKQSF